MGQRLKRSSLFFKQAGQEPPKPTLSGFYRGVGEAQTGAVQDIGQKVQEQAAELPGKFGIKYDTEAKPEFAGDSAFKPTVDVKTGITAVKPPETGFATSEQATKAVEQATKNIEQLEAERKAAEAGLGKSSEEALTKAGETAKTAQERLTEKKLGERREASEIEKAAQDYRNILQTTPGTSNVAAVASLMKFYDPKYKTLESSLRQGEISLARQQAGEVEGAMQQAESQRAGAIEEYRQTSTQAYEDTKKLIDQEKQDKLKKIEDFYSSLSKTEKGSKEAATAKAKELKAAEDTAAAEKKAIEASETQKIGDTLFGSPDPVTGVRRGGKFDNAFNQIDAGSQWQTELDEYKKAENDMFFREHKGWTRDKQRIEAKINLHREYRNAMLALKNTLQEALDRKDYAAVKEAQNRVDVLLNEYKRRDLALPVPSKRVRAR